MLELKKNTYYGLKKTRDVTAKITTESQDKLIEIIQVEKKESKIY